MSTYKNMKQKNDERRSANVDINKRKTCRKQTTVGKLFSDRNPSRGMRSLLKASKYTVIVEFHSVIRIVCAVNNADKLMKEHFFPWDWPLKPSSPWWILPEKVKTWCQYYHEFSVKKELREAKPPSIEGSVIAEYAHLSHFRAHIWMT